jgi:cysteine-rich repeat protein
MIGYRWFAFILAAVLLAGSVPHDADAAACGNGRVGHGEGCDDGNLSSGDGCGSNCMVELGWACTGVEPSACTNEDVCANGDVEAGESCDDGNLTAGDGCTPFCTVQPGYSCTGNPSVCVPPGNVPILDCGNGFIEAGEECDDASTTPGDGCSADCQVEAGFECTGVPSVCSETDCGNGTLDAGEDCDSGPCCDDDCSFATSTQTCRTAAGGCDAPETCSGSSATCGPDLRRPSTFVCRPAVSDQCDVAETCNGTSATCPDDELAGCTDPDGEGCLTAVCDPSGQCTTGSECAVVCRKAKFWATRATTGKDPEAAVDLVLDQSGPIEVCGQTIDNAGDLGELDSALEGLCVRTQGEQERDLYRELLTAALNCLVSEGGECDEILAPLVDVSFSDCNALCEGSTIQGGPTIEECIDQLECFNSGGRLVEGECATGTCESDPEELCGGDFGFCSADENGDDADDDEEDECIGFDDNCADARLCQSSEAEVRLCGRRLVPRNNRVCKDARSNQCTIDECD